MRTLPLALSLTVSLALLPACGPATIKVDDTAPAGTDDSDPDPDDSDPNTDDSTAPDDSEDSEDSPPDTGPDVPIPLPDVTVDCNGGADYTTIQEAIDAAISPARIAVFPCTYYERLDFNGKVIDLYSTDGSEATIIHGSDGGTVIDLEYYEAGWSRIAGFTISDGFDEADGGAMEITGASVELEDILFTDNRGLSLVRGTGASIDMRNVRFEANDTLSEGQAIYVDPGNLNIYDSYIDCGGGTQAIWHHVQLIISDSTVVCDSGYGVYDYHGEDYILRSSIYGGIAGFYAADTESTPEEPDSPTERFYVENSVLGGGEYGAQVLYMHLELENSVFYGGAAALQMTACDPGSSAVNNVFMGAACGVEADQGFNESYSAFWGNGADGCGTNVRPQVSQDPQFTAFPDDLTLLPGSPLIDAGSPSLDDTDGSRSDIGRYGGPRGAW